MPTAAVMRMMNRVPRILEVYEDGNASGAISPE